MQAPPKRRLQELAQSLTTTGDATVMMRRVAETALLLGRASGVYVERFSEANGAEVIASVGDGVPVLGSTSAYPGALTGASSQVDTTRFTLGTESVRCMISRDGDEFTVVFPIEAERIPLGTLVLRKPGKTQPFPVQHLDRVGVLAHIAGLALRKAALAETIERVIEDKFRLISGITYGLKESLGTAAEYIDMLELDGPLTDRQREYAVRSRRSIDSAVRLISELVELERAENGRVALNFEEANVGAHLRDIANDFRLAAGTTGLDIAIDVPPDLPTIETDIDCVRQILDNLLSNAVRYTPVGSRVHVMADVRSGRRTTDPEQWVCLMVADSGPGIEDSERVFEEVYRVERSAGPVGFRLAISRRLARLLGGELRVESQPGEGAVFTLWLPSPRPVRGLGSDPATTVPTTPA